MDAITFTCQLAPVSVLEFAEMAEAAGGMNFLTGRALANNSIVSPSWCSNGFAWKRKHDG